MARASDTEQTGSIGVSEAMGKFARIGFGYAEVARHDNGTDVFLMARDARRFDLGLTLAAQVKGGASWFESPVHNKEGELEGWWFDDSDGRHVNDWLKHGLPHLLLLHNLDEDQTYWAHVCPETVSNIGRRRLALRKQHRGYGKRVFVSRDQRVDEESREALIRIAAESRPSPRWEGSVWAGVCNVADTDMLRFALIVPRLVAPHPNASPQEPISPYQAIAMVMQARISDLAHLEDKALVQPEPTDWRWRFFEALRNRVTEGSISGLSQARTMAVNADSPDEAAAATACLAACLIEDDQADAARDLLEEFLQFDKAFPVDNAWLQVQLARAYAETGRTDQARELAIEVQSVLAANADDVTATAIAGVGAQVLFTLSDFGATELASAIQGADTSARWWRQQTRGWALGASLERAFAKWSRERKIRLYSTDTANDLLVASILNANFTGDHDDWRSQTSLLAKDHLTKLDRTASAEHCADLLDMLRQSGQKEAVRWATHRLVQDGPAMSVRISASRLNLDHLTRTNARASLELLRRGGAAMSPGDAGAATLWLLKTLDDPSGFVSRCSITSWITLELVDALAGVIGAADHPAREATIEYIVNLPPVTEQLIAQSWAQVVRRLGSSVLPQHHAAVIHASTLHHEALNNALRALVRDSHQVARHALLADIHDGSQSALAAWGSVVDLPSETVALVVAQLARELTPPAPGIELGSTSSALYGLAVLSGNHTDHAKWETIIDYLERLDVDLRRHGDVLVLLAGFFDKLPTDIKSRVTQVALRVLSLPPADEWESGLSFAEDAVGGATLLLVVAEHPSCHISLTRLWHARPDLRNRAVEAAARLALKGEVSAAGLVIGSCSHDDERVRAVAAVSLVDIYRMHTVVPALALAALEVVARERGMHAPLSLARALGDCRLADNDFESVRTILRSHELELVRESLESSAGP